MSHFYKIIRLKRVQKERGNTSKKEMGNFFNGPSEIYLTVL